MNVQEFYVAFERMRSENLGVQFERRELGILAPKYGIYINSNMWASGLGRLFNVSKLGPKYVYSFKNSRTSRETLVEVLNALRAYRNNRERAIAHARAILRRYGVLEED